MINMYVQKTPNCKQKNKPHNKKKDHEAGSEPGSNFS